MARRNAQTSEYVQSRTGFTRMKGGQPTLLGQKSSCPSALGSPLREERISERLAHIHVIHAVMLHRGGLGTCISFITSYAVAN